MFLQRIHLNLRCREARRDLADPYQLHSTLCRAFSPPDQKCLEGEFLWRLEPETDSLGPRILVQSRAKPDWGGISGQAWLSKADPAIDLIERLKLNSLQSGNRVRSIFQNLHGSVSMCGFPRSRCSEGNSIPVTLSGYIQCYTMDFSP